MKNQKEFEIETEYEPMIDPDRYADNGAGITARAFDIQASAHDLEVQ
jgi:hypothetical protein